MSVQHISAQEFASKGNQLSGIVIDLRTVAEVATEALENYHCLPIQELTTDNFQQLLETIGHQDQPVYLLCQSGKRAEMAVEKLKGISTPPLVIIDGGLNHLKSAGVKVIKGNSHVISLERQVRIAAGALTLIGVVLGSVIHPYLYGVSAFVGAGLMFAGITNTCGMAMILARLPWNNVKA